MTIRGWAAGAAIATALAMSSAAYAQPQTKLTSRLGKPLIQAIWCSALFFEGTYSYEGGEDFVDDLEDMAFDLGEDIDATLRDAGMAQPEIDEIWEIYDGTAFDLALDDIDSFNGQLLACERGYDNLMP